MRILAVESSAGPASCAVYQEGQVLACTWSHTGLTHSRTLLPMIDSLLKNADIPLDSIHLFAVAAGPGSFTGVRIGVATIKGLAFDGNKPCAGVSTLAAMARTAVGLPFDGIVCAAMDARRHQVYAALFEHSHGSVSRLTEDAVLSAEELGVQAAAFNKPILLIGDGAQLCRTQWENIPSVFLAPPAIRYQNAVGVAMEAAASPEYVVPSSSLMPVYLRPSQAERERKDRQKA